MSDAVPRPAEPPKPGTGARLLIDFTPLLVFFAVNGFAPVADQVRIFYATGAFMAAMIVAMLWSQLRYKHISPLLLFSGLMVVVLGGATIWLHEEWIIKVKPTLYYLIVAALLGFGLATKRNLLKLALGAVYPGLTERGWHLLTRNFIVFFIGMAVLNEIIWRTTSTTFWAGSKLWLFVPATVLFGLANVPMLVRNGLVLDDPVADLPGPPSQ